MTEPAQEYVHFSVSHSSLSEPVKLKLPANHNLSGEQLLDDILFALNFKDRSGSGGPSQRDADRTFHLYNKTTGNEIRGNDYMISHGDHLELQNRATSA